MRRLAEKRKKHQKSRAFSAQIQVLEAVMVAIMMILAVSFMTSFTLPSQRKPYGRQQLQSLIEGKLRVLYNMPLNTTEDKNAYNDCTLLKFVSEGVTGSSSDLSDNINETLPGVYYNVYLSNGISRYPVYVQNENPPASAVSASHIITAPWTYTLIFTDTDLYSSLLDTTPMFVSAIPVYKASVLKNLSSLPIVFSNGDDFTLSQASGKYGLYEKSNIPRHSIILLPPSIRKGYATSLISTVSSTLSYNGISVSGTTSYGADIILSLLSSLLGALHTSCSISLSAREAGPGETVNISYDFGGLLLPTVSLDHVTINIYSPILGHLEETYERSGLLGSSYTYSYTVPYDSIFGPYVVEGEGALLIGGIPAYFRLVDFFTVTLPDGSEPISPAYEVQIVAWYPEWY